MQTIIAMAETLGLREIAEDVKTEAQREFIELRGCPAYQGHLFGEAVAVEQFKVLLKRWEEKRAVLAILTYCCVCSGRCAPASHTPMPLATISVAMYKSIKTDMRMNLFNPPPSYSSLRASQIDAHGYDRSSPTLLGKYTKPNQERQCLK